jgi:hypothetical protein
MADGQEPAVDVLVLPSVFRERIEGVRDPVLVRSGGDALEFVREQKVKKDV